LSIIVDPKRWAVVIKLSEGVKVPKELEGSLSFSAEL